MPPRHPVPVPGSAELAPEEIRVMQHRVACDGGGGALGHPLVYMEIGDSGAVECGYCDRRFVLVADLALDNEYRDPAPRHDAH